MDLLQIKNPKNGKSIYEVRKSVMWCNVVCMFETFWLEDSYEQI